MLKRVIALLVLVLCAAPVLAEGPAKSRLVVWFKTQSGLKMMTEYLKESSTLSMDGNSRMAAELVEKARRRFAEKLGYSTSIYGQDNWKLAGPMVVARVRLYNPAGRFTELSMR
jgi:hypothetical protein